MPTLTPSSNQKLFAVSACNRRTAAAIVINASALRSESEEKRGLKSRGSPLRVLAVVVLLGSGAFTVAEWYLESGALNWLQ
jgi:hypothetical protein